MTTYQYLLRHPNSRKHQAYMQQQIANLRAYNPAKQSKRNVVKSLIIKYESLLDRVTLLGA